MEFLPAPLNPKHRSIEVRLQEVPAAPYDNGDYLEYPERQGWKPRSSQEWAKIFKPQNQAFCAFLERWLLLAPLLIWFNCQLDADDQISFLDLIYYKEGSEYPIFTLKKVEKRIHQYVEDKNIRITCQSFNKMLEMFKESRLLHFCLLNYGKDSLDSDDEVSDNRKTQSLAEFIRSRPYDPRSEAVVTATELVHNLLSFEVNRTDGKNMLGYNHIIPTFRRSPVWRWMLKDKWCPSDLARHFGELPVASLLFLYNMGPPKPDENHPIIPITNSGTSDSSHISLCSPLKCAHRQLTEDGYERKHSEGCQGCEDVVADPKELHRIIEKGSIPLVLSIEANDSNNTVAFVEGEPDKAYVAISHVWSDGLGNPQRNALPRCQLLRLSSLVRNLPGEHKDTKLFWCDTLCIPRKSAATSNTKALALSQMRNIYYGASAVLVLESTLCNFAIKQRSHIEILLKIFSCTWNTRLWTYQEGALAKSLIFQFSDMTYDLDVNILNLEKAENPIERVFIGADLSRQYKSLRGFRKLQSQPERLEAAAVALCYRTTTVQTDEALCLATLLDLDVTEIFLTKPELRMARLWKMMPKIPKYIIFNSRPSFSEEGLRWAPLTFLASSQNSTKDCIPRTPIRLGCQIFGIASRTDLGLRVKYPGLRFRIGPLGFAKPFYLLTTKGLFYFHLKNWKREWSYREYGIITCWDPDKTAPHTEIAISSNVAMCVLVGIRDTISDKGRDVYLCHKLENCVMERSKQRFIHYKGRRYFIEGGKDFYMEDENGFVLGDAKETPSDQLWQVG